MRHIVCAVLRKASTGTFSFMLFCCNLLSSKWRCIVHLPWMANCSFSHSERVENHNLKPKNASHEGIINKSIIHPDGMVHCVLRVLCADELWLRVGRSTSVLRNSRRHLEMQRKPFTMQSVSSTPACTSWQHLLLHAAFFSLSMFAHIQTISIMKCFLSYYSATIFYLHCMWLRAHNARPSPTAALWWKCLNSKQHKAVSFHK